MDRFAQLAMYLHSKFCTKKHTQQCKTHSGEAVYNCAWYLESEEYGKKESKDNLWEYPDHNRWYKKARQVEATVRDIWN